VKKIFWSIAFLIASPVCFADVSYGLSDETISGIQLGVVDQDFGGGLFSHVFISESFFIPQFVRATYKNNAGAKLFPLNIGGGVGFDFNKIINDKTSKIENFHPYISGTFDVTLLFANPDNDLGLGYTASVGGYYLFDWFALGAEFNHNFVNYMDTSNSNSQNYLLTLGAKY